MLFLGDYKLQAELRERRAVEEEHGDVDLLLEPLEAEVDMNGEHGEGALVDPVVYLQTWIPLISEDDKGKWTTIVAVHSTKCMTDCLYFNGISAPWEYTVILKYIYNFRIALEKFHK